jgi:hypothetical protein
MQVIRREPVGRLEVNPVEALMLLDILKNEECALRRMADEASSSSMRIRFQ